MNQGDGSKSLQQFARPRELPRAAPPPPPDGELRGEESSQMIETSTLPHMEDTTTMLSLSKVLSTSSYADALERCRGLDLDIFAYEGDELVPLVAKLMDDTCGTDRCVVPMDYLRNWSWAVRRLYQDNPYHNWYHGFGVFQHSYHQMVASSISNHFRYIDVFGLLVAALCHDADHPGVTNGFLVEEGSELAIRYNDQSVLENHHAHLACDLLRRDETAVGCGLGRAEQQDLRRIIMRSILDTDMIKHAEHCQAITARLGDSKKEADH